MNVIIKKLAIFILISVSGLCFSQQGQVTINQDKNIPKLLKLKGEINKDENASDRYKIQIYNGNRSDAYSTEEEFLITFKDWRSTVVYEPPNFKTWAGNFRTRLEADRALKKIKVKFPSAFIFKPKKDKN